MGAWFTSDRPPCTTPSSAMRSPGFTSINEPGVTRSMWMRWSPCSSRTLTSVGDWSTRFPIACRARSRLCASSHCASANNDTTKAASSYCRMSAAPTTAMIIRTLISRDPRRKDRQARCAGKMDPTAAATRKIGVLHSGNGVTHPRTQATATSDAAMAVHQPRRFAPVGAGASASQCEQPMACACSATRGLPRRPGRA